MDDKETEPPHLPETLRRLGAAALAMLHNRLELLAIELHEERLRFFEALLMVLAIFGLALIMLALAASAVIILLWKSFGVIGLLVLSGVCLLATLLVLWRLYLRLKHWPLLPGTIEQLKKDRECFENK